MSQNNTNYNEAPTTKQCKVCQKEIAKHLKFCTNCGAKQTLINNAKLVICKKCGGDVASNLERCPHCREKTPLAKLRAGIAAAAIAVFAILFIGLCSSTGGKDEPTRELKNGEETASGEVSKTSEKEDKKENIIFENDDYKVTYVDFEDKELGITMFHLTLKFENKSDKSVAVTFEESYANDTAIQFISGFPLEILPGKNAVAHNGFGYDGLGFDSIDDVKKLEFKLVIRDSESFREIMRTDTLVLNF